MQLILLHVRMTADLGRRIEKRSARPPMNDGCTVWHDEFLLDLIRFAIGRLMAGVVESSEFGFDAKKGDVEGAGDGPVAAVHAGNVDVRVVVDFGELGVVEGGLLGDRRYPAPLEFGVHARIDVLEGLAPRVASAQGCLEVLSGRVRGLDHGQDIVQEAREGDEFLKVLLICHGENTVDGGLFVSVPAHAAPFWLVKETWLPVLKCFHDEGVAASSEYGETETGSMSVWPTQADKVACTSCMLDPRIPVYCWFYVSHVDEMEDKRLSEGSSSGDCQA